MTYQIELNKLQEMRMQNVIDLAEAKAKGVSAWLEYNKNYTIAFAAQIERIKIAGENKT